VVWKASAASAIDLHAFLPTSYTNSEATSIDAAGNIVGYGWNAVSTGLRNDHAFLWAPK